jgi:Porin PorA
VKLSKGGIVCVIIGLVLVLIAPVWKWGIAPSVVKLPDTIDQTLIYEGVLTLHVDPTSMSPLPPEMAVKIPLTIIRKDISDPAKSDKDVAVVKEPLVAKGPGNQDFLSYTKYYALDRKTAKNVPGHNSNVDRKDYSLTLGFFVDKDGTYRLWDDDVANSGALEYVKTTKMDGLKYKDIDVIEFKGSTEPEKTVSPPLGLPSKISGAQIKAVLNNPGLPFNDTDMYPIDYLKKTSGAFRTDQKTGSIFDVIKNKEEYYVDATALGMGKLLLGTLEYSQTPLNVKENLDLAAKNYMLLDSVEIYFPVIMLILGGIFLLIGIVLIVMKRTS